MLEQVVEIRAGSSGIPARVETVQNDSGRSLRCFLTDMIIPEGAVARIYGQKPSKLEIYNDCEISGNQVVVDLTTQILAEIGIVTCQVEITKDGERVTSFDLYIEVKKSRVSESAIESKDEFTALENALKDAEGAAYKAVSDYIEENGLVSGATKEQAEQIEKNAYDISNLSESLSTKANAIHPTATGSTIVATDSSEDTPKGLNVYGKSTQKTTPGNQLLPNCRHETVTESGITYTNNGDGTYTLNGTSTAYVQFIDSASFILAAGTYNMSGGDIYTQIRSADGGTVLKSGNGSFTLEEETEVKFRQTVGTPNVTYANKLFSPMINKGTTALPWEPYTNGPSPNPEYQQDIENRENTEVGVYGGNLLPYPYVNKNYNIAGVTFEETDGRITVNGTPQANYCDYYLYGSNIDSGTYMYFPKGEYNVSLMPINASFDGFNEFIAFRTLERGAVLNSSAIKRALMETGLHVYGIFVRAGDVGKTYNNVIIQPIISMINTAKFTDRFVGDNQYLTIPHTLCGIPVTDASLATYTDDNGQMWVCDEVDYKRGVYTQRVKDIYLNKSNFNIVYVQQDYCRFHFSTDILFDVDTYISRAMPVISNKLIFSSGAMNGCYLGTVGDNGWKGLARILVKTPLSVDTIDKFMEYVGEDCVVKCILATPIETPLTEEEIAAYKALKMNYPTTTILNDANAHMKVEYIADTQNHIEQNYVPVAKYTALEARVSALEQNALS